MIYTYKECIEKYGSDYEFRKVLTSGKLKRVSRGVYSDDGYCSELDIIRKSYPHAVFTMNSAFYFQGLTDTIPQFYHLMTDKDATKITDERVHQYFDNCNSLTMGVETKTLFGSEISVFTRERLLIELVRNKSKLPFDYYKEVISNYRKMIYDLDIQAIHEYAIHLPKTKLVLETLQLEVF